MSTHATAVTAAARPCLADLLAAREPARQARRLLTYVTLVSRRPPLDRDLCTAMTARCHAEALCASVATALGAREAAAALAATEHARRALVHLRAVLHVALAEGLLHPVQFGILARQATHTHRALVELEDRARTVGGAGRPGSRRVGPAGRAAAAGRAGATGRPVT